MSRTQESGAYLGGIGAMLEVANVCPACGEAHSDRQFGFKHRSARECPRVIMGSFPVATMPNPPLEAPIRVPAARQIQDAERPRGALMIPTGTFVPPRGDSDRSRSRSLGVLWLPLPDLGEVL
jgi:hypothetical protein